MRAVILRIELFSLKPNSGTKFGPTERQEALQPPTYPWTEAVRTATVGDEKS